MRVFRRKLALFLLAVAACISVIGTGFSAWFFLESDMSGSLGVQGGNTANVVVTASTTLVNGGFIVNDLPALVVLDGGSVGGVNNTRTGINFYKSGKSKYDTKNDNANYDENGNKEKNPALPEEILVDTQFEIKFWYIGPNADIPFYINLDVPAALDRVITHSRFYYSYVSYTNESTTPQYYIDLKKIAQDWGEYSAEAETVYLYTNSDNSVYMTAAEANVTDTDGYTQQNGEFTRTTYTFTLSTTLLNSFFTYTDGYEGTGLKIHDAISELFSEQTGTVYFSINLFAGEITYATEDNTQTAGDTNTATAGGT